MRKEREVDRDVYTWMVVFAKEMAVGLYYREKRINSHDGGGGPRSGDEGHVLDVLRSEAVFSGTLVLASP